MNNSKWSKYNEEIDSIYQENSKTPYRKASRNILGDGASSADIDLLRVYVKRHVNSKNSNGNDEFSKALSDGNFAEPNDWKHGWLKTDNVSVFVRNAGLSIAAIKDGYIEAVKEAIGVVDWGISPEPSSSSNLFVPCIFDLHLGKLAWGEETGEDYDSKIAVRRFRMALEDLIQKAEGHKIEQILFPVGNDIYNSDKAKPFPQTTAGTPQMDDLRWQKLFRMGVQLITEAVIRLSKIAPVNVKMVYSNHDHERVFYLGETLTAVFSSHKTVTIDNDPKVRKYYQWGKCLIGLAHGHNEKPNDLPLIMAQESPEMWGSTLYREWLLGHLHHRKTGLTETAKDYRGVNVRFLTSPSAADAWHYEKAFVGAIKGAEGFIYNKDRGIENVMFHNIY
jgi:hypothetical protein